MQPKTPHSRWRSALTKMAPLCNTLPIRGDDTRYFYSHPAVSTAMQWRFRFCRAPPLRAVSPDTSPVPVDPDPVVR